MEAWRNIPGWGGFYQVSDAGRIRSVDRLIDGSRPCQPFRHMRGRIIRPAPMKNGYLGVRLSMPGGRVKTVYVHHAVLLAFKGPRPEGLDEIRHLDGVKHNCRLENIVYGTQLENAADRKRHAAEATK